LLGLVGQLGGLCLLVLGLLVVDLLRLLKLVELLEEILLLSVALFNDLLQLSWPHCLRNLCLVLLLEPLNLISQLLQLCIFLLALGNHCIHFGFFLLQRLDLLLLLFIFISILLEVLRCLLLLKNNLILIQLGELTHDLRDEQAHLDLPLTRSALLAVVLRYICNLSQCLSNTIFDFLFLNIDIIIIVLQASNLLLLDGGNALVAILLNQINFAGELLGPIELFSQVVDVSLHL